MSATEYQRAINARTVGVPDFPEARGNAFGSYQVDVTGSVVRNDGIEHAAAPAGSLLERARKPTPLQAREAYLNAIGTAVPANEVHGLFTAYAPRLLEDGRARRLFGRMVDRCGIDCRYSVLEPSARAGQLDDAGLYREGAFADTGARMRVYEQRAGDLAFRAAVDLDDDLDGITHLVVVSCTGFAAPGLDLDLIDRLALNPRVERTGIGFMGCYAALNALRLARHVVRSEPDARVLIVSVELCTLHLQETSDLEQVLSFLIFADGAAAALVTGERRGLALDRSTTVLVREAADQITWRIGRTGFDMKLSGGVASTIAASLPPRLAEILSGAPADAIEHWAIHPGGRSILDAVARALALEPNQLAPSRDVLRRYGNMSSATVLFVLKDMLASRVRGPGCAIAFGPGLAIESLRFEGLG
jgi:alpha-pyrone synthase